MCQKDIWIINGKLYQMKDVEPGIMGRKCMKDDVCVLKYLAEYVVQ